VEKLAGPNAEATLQAPQRRLSLRGSKEGTKCLDWFMCLKEIPKSKLDLPPMWK